MERAVTTSNESSEHKNCKGKCILEMEKKLDPKVISEFLTVIRDFHNDDQTLTKLKNTVSALHKETIELLNEKTMELLAMIDDIFLNRRRQQTSFYRLCHKLVRKGLPENSSLPDESKCVCFSEKNLSKYNVDPAADSCLRLVTNFSDIKNCITNLTGALECTKCVDFPASKVSKGSNELVCRCSVPSCDTQLKVHEAVLKTFEDKEQRTIEDSWYLTNLKRDVQYYQNRFLKSLQASDESLNSFEIISHTYDKNLKSSFDLGETESEKEEKRMKIPQHKICSVFAKLSAANESDVDSEYCESYDSDSDSEVSSRSSCMTDDSKKCANAELPTGKENVKKISEKSPDEITTNKPTPAEILKESLKCYSKNVLPRNYVRFSLHKLLSELNPSPVASVDWNVQNRGVSSKTEEKKPIESFFKGKMIDLSLMNLRASKENPNMIREEKSVDPYIALKSAFSVYSSKVTNNKWLCSSK